MGVQRVVLLCLVLGLAWAQNWTSPLIAHPNVPLLHRLDRGQVQFVECVVPQSVFQEHEKVSVRVSVSALVSVRLYQQSCGQPCKDYQTNDRLLAYTEYLTFYREEQHKDLVLIAEVKAIQSVAYSLNFILYFDNTAPVISLQQDEVAVRRRVADQPQVYSHVPQNDQFLEINVETMSPHDQACLHVSAGYQAPNQPYPKIQVQWELQARTKLILKGDSPLFRTNETLLIQVERRTTCPKGAVDYEIEVSSQKSLSFLNLDRDRFAVLQAQKHQTFEVYLGNTTGLTYQVSLKPFRVSNASFPPLLTAHSSLLHTAKIMSLTDEQSLVPSQMDSLCAEPSNCSMYLRVSNQQARPISFRLSLRQQNMPIRLVLDNLLRLSLSALSPRTTFFYLLPADQLEHDFSVHLSASPESGVDLRFSLLKNREMGRINEYLHNKIDDGFQQETNQHTLTLNIKADTLHKCSPTCLLVLVVSPSRFAYDQNGQVTLQVTRDALHIHPETTHRLLIQPSSPKEVILDTHGLYVHQRSLMLIFSSPRATPDLIVYRQDSSADGSFDSEQSRTTYLSNRILVSPSELKDVALMKLRIHSRMDQEVVLSVSTYLNNRVLPKRLYPFDVSSQHDTNFVLFNTLPNKELQIKVLPQDKQDYSALQVSVRKCLSFQATHCEDRNMSLSMGEDNSFHFKHYFSVGKYVTQFSYFLIQFQAKWGPGLKGHFYVDENDNSFQRLFLNHQTNQLLRSTTKKYLFRFYEGPLDIYTLNMDVRAGHPKLMVLYEEFHNLTDQAIKNEFVTKEESGQRHLALRVNSHVAQLAMEKDRHSRGYYYNNEASVELPVLVQCSDTCDYTLEPTLEHKQMLRFNQIYQTQETHHVLDDQYLNLDLFRSEQNKDKPVYMYVKKNGGKEEVDMLDVQVQRFNMQEKNSDLIGIEQDQEEPELVMSTSHSSEYRLPLINKDVYQVSFKQVPGVQVVFNLQHQVMLLPIHDHVLRSLSGVSTHSYLLGDPHQDGTLHLSISKCTSGLSFVLQTDGHELNILDYNATTDSVVQQIKTSQYRTHPIMLSVQHHGTGIAQYKVSLDFSESDGRLLGELVGGGSSEVRVEEDSDGNVQVGVDGLGECRGRECDDYRLDNVQLHYEFLLSGHKQYLNAVGQCRLQMDQLATLLEGQYEHNHQLHANEVFTQNLTMPYKNRKDKVSVWFTKQPQESVIMVTAILKGVVKRGHDGLFRPVPPVAIPFPMATHHKKARVTYITQLVYHHYFSYLLITIAATMLILFIQRRYYKISQAQTENLQIQIHQLRDNEVIDQDTTIQTDSTKNDYQKI